ncbi:MAG: membrane lipoprotein lipid attachment site-containing protein [Alistipes sp.]|nr:membrane lipoprotein lipid attachment site-containing protein [Alistipes sp.]
MKKILLALSTMLILASCDNFGPEQSWTKAFTDKLITTSDASATPYEAEATVTLNSPDIAEPMLNIAIEGARFIDGMPSVNFLLENLTFTMYDNNGDVNDPLTGAWVINYASVVPKIGGVLREDHTLLNFRATITSEIVLEFDVNYRGVIFHVTFGKHSLEEEETMWVAQHSLDVTTVSAALGTFDDEADVAFVQSDRSVNKFDIKFADVQFAAMMPKQISFTFEEVAFTEVEHNEWGMVKSFEVASIVPLIDGEPNEQYTFTNVKGIVSEYYVEITMNYSSFAITMRQSTLPAE